MAVTLKHIKKIVSEEFVNTNQLLLNAIFGNDIPEPHDPTKGYKKGDAIIKVLSNGTYEIQVTKNDGITGPGVYNPDDWNTISFTDLFKEGSSLDIDFSKAIQFTKNKPEDKDNMLWLEPLRLKVNNGEDLPIGGGGGVVVYENEHFAAQYDQPDGQEVRLWFDYEDDEEEQKNNFFIFEKKNN